MPPIGFTLVLTTSSIQWDFFLYWNWCWDKPFSISISHHLIDKTWASHLTSYNHISTKVISYCKKTLFPPLAPHYVHFQAHQYQNPHCCWHNYVLPPHFGYFTWRKSKQKFTYDDNHGLFIMLLWRNEVFFSLFLTH